jgi:hypothetical protein
MIFTYHLEADKPYFNHYEKEVFIINNTQSVHFKE